MHTPKPLPANPSLQDLAQYVSTEMQSAAQAGRDKLDSVEFNPLSVAVKKPRTGALVYADGSNWNPSNGEGLYTYTSGWKKVGPQVTGTAVLVAGTKVVSLASITANSRIFLTSQADGGTPGFLRVSARTAGASFTILSSNALDTSTVGYLVIEP